MAQNIVLSWLGGCRIVELKTVQIRDELEIPRPCIDMQTVGYNVEWSQELKLAESLQEYVKGAMLLEILKTSDALGLPAAATDTVLDVSVGYDLAGIRSEPVQVFLRGMRDAGALIDRLREQIPADFAWAREVDFPTRLADTLTLSTFHGCPPDEIERMIGFLLEEHRFHCIVKLNPMLLGPADARRLLHDVLGYDDVVIPDSAFARDTKWEQMEGFVERLSAKAAKLGLGFGVKFSNTLIVENHREFFPASEKEMYLSGQPLHVLAMTLVQRFRERFGAGIPVSFSAGIDRTNFPDAVALGLVPVTVCTDLLRPGGYGRARGYLEELAKRMRDVGARTVDELIRRAYGHEEAHVLRNTRTYVERVSTDPRYRKNANAKVPKKIGRHLRLFDCISCDKCVPVCPNDANFTFVLPRGEIPSVRIRRVGERWVRTGGDPVRIEEKHQIGNFADFCNDCGNCDVFCPEDGGPYVIKPRFFGSEEAWAADGRDGLFVGWTSGTTIVLGRFAGSEYRLETPAEGPARYSGAGFDLTLDPENPEGTVEGDAEGDVDLVYARLMDLIRRAVHSEGAASWMGALRSD